VEYEVSAIQVREQALAVIRAEIPYAEIASRLRPLYDRIYEHVGRGDLTPSGHNVILYRDGRPGTWATEVGIQVARPFSAIRDSGVEASETERVVCSKTPAGTVATCTHLGPYHELGSAHDAILAWCEQSGRRREGLRWEVYGDWTEDERKLRTDVFYLLEAEE